MCGCYQLTAEGWEEIRQMAQGLQRRLGGGAWQAGEIRPNALAPVLLEGRLELMRWGYPLSRTLIINARVETAGEKSLFRESVAMRRCAVPATGFYEWDREKRKHLFRLPGERILYMAGLYERRGGKDRYCILTTAANSSVAPVHDRMPLVLRRDQLEPWLGDSREAAALLRSTPPGLELTSAESQLSLW